MYLFTTVCGGGGLRLREERVVVVVVNAFRARPVRAVKRQPGRLISVESRML